MDVCLLTGRSRDFLASITVRINFLLKKQPNTIEEAAVKLGLKVAWNFRVKEQMKKQGNTNGKLCPWCIVNRQ